VLRKYTGYDTVLDAADRLVGGDVCRIEADPKKLTVQECRLTEEDFAAVLSGAEHVAVPVAGLAPVWDCWEAVRGIAVERGFASSRVQWRPDAPAAWSGLAAWTAALQAGLDAHLGVRGPEPVFQLRPKRVNEPERPRSPALLRAFRMWIAADHGTSPWWCTHTQVHHGSAVSSRVRRLSAWIMTSHEEAVFRVLEDPSYTVQTSRQDQSIADAPVQIARYLELMGQGSATLVNPVRFDLTIGTDGDQYVIEVGQGQTQARLAWWSGYPRQWEPLDQWFAEMATFLDECIDAGGQRGPDCEQGLGGARRSCKYGAARLLNRRLGLCGAAARVSPGDPSTSCQDDVKGEARSEPATGDLPAQDVDRAPVRRQAERDTNGGRRA
jgi:hypothetical protein